jgi:homocysteine S-methyltransferase
MAAERPDLITAIGSVEGTLIADGGMATSLYDKGFFINRSFEELCLTHPEAVREVTAGFKKAGAQLLLTNTFSATVPKLTGYGLQGQQKAILKAATEIAKSVAQDTAWVLANMGPLGVVIEPLGPTAIEEAFALFQKTAQIFEDSEVDGFSLECFHDLKELQTAIAAIRSVSSKPILAHIAIQENLRTSYGHTLTEFAALVGSNGVQVAGISGEVGPSGVFSALEQLRGLTEMPISLKPNAGLPQYVNDQYIYLCNPDYLAKYSKRFIQAGARIVGGNSGVSEGHIRAIANTIRMLRPQNSGTVRQVKVEASVTKERRTAAFPLKERSRLGKYLSEGRRVLSVELNPPKGIGSESFTRLCRELGAGGVEFVNIPDGARAMARMSSLQLATFVKNQLDLEPIPHLTCRDRNLIGLQSDLLGCYVNGVRNLLLVTGDPPKLGNCPDASAVYDVDSIGLTHIVANMNRGTDLGGSDFGQPTQYVIGVALNPTAHNQELEIRRFRYKIEAGADYAITQPIYDVEAYERFFAALGPIDIPVIMGIWPLVSLRNAEFLKNEVPGVEVPDWIIAEMEKAGDSKDEALKRGLDIAVQTMARMKDRVAGFQVSAPFNRVDFALKVIHAL